MEPRIEVKNFADGRLKVMMRFFAGPNFWINGQVEATWVPTFEELDALTTLKDAVVAVDNFNNEKKGKRNHVPVTCEISSTL